MTNKINTFYVAILSLQVVGCSTLRDNFLQRQTPILTTNESTYEFIPPRRAALPSTTINKLTEQLEISRQFTYYSANGHLCRNLSLSPIRSACLINGEWRQSAQILLNKHSKK